MLVLLADVTCPVVELLLLLLVVIGSRLCPLDLDLGKNTWRNTKTKCKTAGSGSYLFVLYVHKVFCYRRRARRLLSKGEEAEAPALLLLLVVHYDNLKIEQIHIFVSI